MARFLWICAGGAAGTARYGNVTVTVLACLVAGVLGGWAGRLLIGT